MTVENLKIKKILTPKIYLKKKQNGNEKLC